MSFSIVCVADHAEADLVDRVSLLRVRDLAREAGERDRAQVLPPVSLERAMRTFMEHSLKNGARGLVGPWSHDLE